MTPTTNKKMNPISTNFCCNPILPLVYDESLSYYEMVCKMVAKMNEIIEAVNGNISSLIEEYFNKIMIDAVYDEDAETITLKKELIVNATTHSYDLGERSMTIE